MPKRLILSICLSFIILKVNAASFGTYRIYIDSEKPHDKFVVKNNSVFPEQCEISFSYVQYTANGQAVKLDDLEQATGSKPALDRLRYSPNKFTIQPKSFQYISFKYRRQINDTIAEYRTYVNFTCTAIKPQQLQQAGLNLSPSIIHAIPLVIRTAPLSRMALRLSFVNIQQQDRTTSFRLQHAGDRSFVGNIYLMSENDTKLMTLQRNFAFYPEMTYKDFTFDLGEYSDEKVKIVFQEGSQYGGNELFELSLQGAK
jgi:hypothetical protein